MPTQRTLKDKTLVITGASRGIGLAIALRAARDGARIVLLAKTTEHGQYKVEDECEDSCSRIEHGVCSQHA